MTEPLDPFALAFDSITPPTPTRAIEDPLYASFDAPSEEPLPAPESGPGFTLLNDAGGRFSIDHDTGVVTLADDALLVTERNRVHAVTVRCVEHSGSSYELNLQLRITGRVPQMAHAENDPLASLAASAAEELAPHIELPPAPPRLTAFNAYDLFAGGSVAAFDEAAPFGTLLTPETIDATSGEACLTLDNTPPAPAPRDAHWTI